MGLEYVVTDDHPSSTRHGGFLMALIGSTCRSASLILQRAGLAPFRSILPASDFDQAARQGGCAPKRKRPLIPEVVSWLMMLVALETTSMTQGLCRAWGLVRSMASTTNREPVSEEAFSQARHALSLRFWRFLWHGLQSRYQQRFGSTMRWKGIFRLLAIDGSEVLLPKISALSRFFGRPKGARGEGRRPQARLVALCSVLTGFCLAFKFMPLRFAEHTGLRHLIRRLQRNDLLLLDRGFFSLPGPFVDPPTKSTLPDACFQPGSRIRPANAAAGPQPMDGPLLSHACHPA